MSEWKKVRLGDISIDGGHYGIGAAAVEYDESLPTYLRITDIREDGTIIREGLKSVDDPNACEYYLKPNDLVIARTGASTGRNYFYDGRDGQLVYAGFLIRFSIDERKIWPPYVKYWFQGSEYRTWLLNHTDGSTRANINAVTLGDCPIFCPTDVSTQRKIAAVLGALDDKIENNRKICANLEAQAQAIFKSWFVDFEPFGGKMPQGWKMGKLGDVTIYRQGKIAANELTAETYYSTENMLPDKQGLMPATSLPQIGEVPVCEKGDVLISNIRPYFKKICFSWSHGGHSPDVLCLAAKNDNMRYWLYRQLWDDAFFAYVMSSAKGTKMPRGDKEQILAYGMAIPNENDVARFNAVIEPMCESIVSKGIESRALAATRDALLPKLMSGEIDVEKVKV